jgi:hypothetical protein
VRAPSSRVGSIPWDSGVSVSHSPSGARSVGSVVGVVAAADFFATASLSPLPLHAALATPSATIAPNSTSRRSPRLTPI